MKSDIELATEKLLLFKSILNYKERQRIKDGEVQQVAFILFKRIRKFMNILMTLGIIVVTTSLLRTIYLEVPFYDVAIPLILFPILMFGLHSRFKKAKVIFKEIQFLGK